MISTWTDLAFSLLPFATFAAGIAVERAASRNRIGKRKAANRDLAAELRAPVDLEPCEFSAHWRVRP